MTRLLKIVAGAVFLALLSGCFQAQLYGPVSGTTITITDLRDGSTILSGVQTETPESLVQTYGQDTWDKLGSVGRLWLLGFFLPDLQKIPDNRLYLVSASGGADADSDGNGQEDSDCSPVSGPWRAIVSGAQSKKLGSEGVAAH